MNPPIIEKLRKLLAMASKGTQNEAEIAMAKAQQIAIENGIDLAIVSLQEETPAKIEIIEEEISQGKRLPIFCRYAHWLLNEHFNVRVLVGGSRYHGRSVWIIGDKPDVEFARYVKSFLEEDMQRRWHYYYKSNNVPLRMKHTWAEGVYNGLRRKLRLDKENAVKGKMEMVPESIRADVENKYALILKNKDAHLQDFMQKHYPYLRGGRSSNNYIYHGSDAYNHGLNTGLTMSISRPLPGQATLK